MKLLKFRFTILNSSVFDVVEELIGEINYVNAPKYKNASCMFIRIPSRIVIFNSTVGCTAPQIRKMQQQSLAVLMLEAQQTATVYWLIFDFCSIGSHMYNLYIIWDDKYIILWHDKYLTLWDDNMQEILKDQDHRSINRTSFMDGNLFHNYTWLLCYVVFFSIICYAWSYLSLNWPWSALIKYINI